MSEFLRPLKIFVSGNVLLLFAILFWPAFGDAQTTLTADTAGVAADFWGWSWVVTSTRLLVYLVIEGLTLFYTAKAFLGLKKD